VIFRFGEIIASGAKPRLGGGAAFAGAPWLGDRSKAGAENAIQTFQYWCIMRLKFYIALPEQA
jgi:hypothetical protein